MSSHIGYFLIDHYLKLNLLKLGFEPDTKFGKILSNLQCKSVLRTVI